MNFMNLAVLTIILAACFLPTQNCAAQEQHSWKDTNSQAIQAMRDQKYEESERLFQQALSECTAADGKATIQENLNVLLEKEGKKHEASIEKTDSLGSQSGSALTGLGGDPASAAGQSDIHVVLAQLDAQIKKADSAGDLEMLQSLFQKKLKALKVRDGSETLDYAYCLHFRAQVLQQLHRDDEANALEAEAARLRDALRSLAASGPASPTKTRSSLSPLSLKPIPRERTGPRQPVIENYASSTPQNRSTPHGFRNFTPANAGNTSGYLNGNPNGGSGW